MVPVAVNDEQVDDDGEDFVVDDGGGDDPWAEVVTVKVINALYNIYSIYDGNRLSHHRYHRDNFVSFDHLNNFQVPTLIPLN